MAVDDEAAAVFERHRPYLLGVAYRLTSSWADAEDVVADAWPRWERFAPTVDEPRGWLTRVVGRLALDHLRSARVRHETYVGPWLPEPVVTAAVAAAGPSEDPADTVMWDESIRLAFLVVLDQLAPEQRLAVVLHDAVGMDFAEVGKVIGCSTEAARQHASRGRRRIDSSRVPPRVPTGELWRVLGELSVALQSGDSDRLAELLAPDVVLTGDGGGKVAAARRPLVGQAEVGKFLHGLAIRFTDRALLQPAMVNGDPGLVLRLESDRPQDPKVAVYVFSVRDGRIEAVFGILAPDKVARVPPAEALEDAAMPSVPGVVASDPRPGSRSPGTRPRTHLPS